MIALPIPSHYDADRVGAIWRVPYQERSAAAEAWSHVHAIPPAPQDTFKMALVAVDVQNTFCMPGFELPVRGGVLSRHCQDASAGTYKVSGRLEVSGVGWSERFRVSGVRFQEAPGTEPSAAEALILTSAFCSSTFPDRLF